MANYPNERGIVMTISFMTERNRWACVIPWVCETDIGDPEAVSEDFQSIFSALISAWKLCLAEDTFCSGWAIEAMANSNVIPYRQVFASDANVGTVTGDSTPVQSSMLIAFYSADQIAADERMKVGKSFVGPAPEDLCDSGIITDATLATHLGALGTQMLTQTGSSTGFTWSRALEIDRSPGGHVWKCTYRSVRQTLFTQRRRVTPLM